MLGQPDFAHAAGAEAGHQPVAADREPLVEQLFVDVEHGAPRDEHRAFEHRAQLANVSRPRVRLEPPHRLGRDAVDHLAELSGVCAHEVV